VEGIGQGPLDFHAPTKVPFNLQALVTEGLKTGFSSSSSRRRLVSGLELEKIRIAGWDIRTLSHHVPSTFEHIHPYSHQNMLDN
jgi:hypothetical protein